MLPTQEAHQRLNTQSSWGVGEGSYKQPLPGTYPNSRFPEGNQVFSISHVYKSLHTATLLHSRNGRKPSRSQDPSCQAKATLYARLSKDSMHPL